MSKCSKACMPECEYFTTGGCISPFNCMYKEENGYINSATSEKIVYTGGITMTNDEMIENLKCVIADISAQCKQLEAENAALHERLEKAVELPFELKYTDFYIEPYFGEIKPSLVDDGAKVVIPMYVYFKFNSVEEAKTWLTKQQTGEEYGK